MYKLYNFEAIFLLFLKSQKLPRKVQKSYLVFLRSYINWLCLIIKISYNIKNISSFLLFLSDDYLKKYSRFLLRWKTPKSSINLRIDLLRKLKTFLARHQDLEIKNLKNPEKIIKDAILEEFLSELKDQGMQDITIRNYRSDLSQFLYFLSQNDSAQNF